ncbi:hypothetical protein ENBRE01_3268, partial [Enteropsectra breve]
MDIKLEDIILLKRESQIDIIRYFQVRRMIAPVLFCSTCNTQMTLVTRRSTLDGYAWKCCWSGCAAYKTTRSVRTNSFFEQYRLNMIDVYLIAIYWLKGKQIKEAVDDTRVSRTTCQNIYKNLRQRVSTYYHSLNLKLGGPGIICQIDETKLNHEPKYSVGNWPDTELWAFGIVDTSYSPSLGYALIVEHRDKRTLYPIIQ